MNSRDTTSGNRAKEKLFERERGITGVNKNSRQEGPKRHRGIEDCHHHCVEHCKVELGTTVTEDLQ
jgi:hypothetical protein